MELTTRFIGDTYAEYYNTGKHELAQIYLKSEADKVIAEKDAKILALDAEVFKQKHHAKLFFDERNFAETQLRHQKYKRCLDRSEYWVAVSYQCIDDKHRQQAERHHKKWLELAEKFKPNN